MAVTFQPDPSLAGFNSFVSVADADDYFAKRLHDTAWTTATTGNKESALMWATLQLNTLTWRGARTSGTQLLSFPRVGLSYSESADYRGMSEIYDVGMGGYTVIQVPSTTVPTEIKNATAELGLWLMSSDTTAPTGLEGFKSLKVDTIAIEVLAKDRPSWFSDAVYNLCKIFLLNSSKYLHPTLRVG